MEKYLLDTLVISTRLSLRIPREFRNEERENANITYRVYNSARIISDISYNPRKVDRKESATLRSIYLPCVSSEKNPIALLLLSHNCHRCFSSLTYFMLFYFTWPRRLYLQAAELLPRLLVANKIYMSDIQLLPAYIVTDASNKVILRLLLSRRLKER